MRNRRKLGDTNLICVFSGEIIHIFYHVLEKEKDQSRLRFIAIEVGRTSWSFCINVESFKFILEFNEQCLELFIIRMKCAASCVRKITLMRVFLGQS